MKNQMVMFMLLSILSSTVMALPLSYKYESEGIVEPWSERNVSQSHTNVHPVVVQKTIQNEQGKFTIVPQSEQPMQQKTYKIINNNQTIIEDIGQQTDYHQAEDSKLDDKKISPVDLQNHSPVPNKTTIEPKKSGLLSTSLLFDDKKPISSTYKNKQQSQNVIYINQPAYRYR